MRLIPIILLMLPLCGCNTSMVEGGIGTTAAVIATVLGAEPTSTGHHHHAQQK